MYQLELSVSALMVQLRLPVVAVVKDLVASRSPGPNSNFVRLVKLESCATSHNVDMGRDLSWKHDGITTLNGERSAVDGELGINRNSSRREQGKPCKSVSEMLSGHGERVE